MGLTVGDAHGYKGIALQATYFRYENGISTPNGIPITKSIALQATGLQAIRALSAVWWLSCAVLSWGRHYYWVGS